ncbi:class I SAM-dependent methyltransferase [Alicyclobacillus acidiphilus]|uniref:class I SAM-dependent methyltransferase n=1 Tax=Alicyclobacillus acidiphilus TaxID=182455 RepID=UPI000831408A|nr:class I SAM-dependent methyltransferase [Alicyclobacillus acidiphilus]
MSNRGVANAFDLRQAVVTVPRVGSSEAHALAQGLSAFFGVPFVDRADRGVADLFEATGADVLFVADDPVRILTADMEHPLFFHPSMAAQRIEREQLRGERDRLLRIADVREGDVVVDATLGLGSDAIVFAHAVGASGRVIGLEKSPVLAGLLQAVQVFGCQRYAAAAQLLQRVDVQAVDHVTWLKQQPSASVDVVYFDPMFRMPASASASIEPVRPFAAMDELSDAAIEEAKRVARRAVVVKERPASGVFQRHGLVPDALRRKVGYGVWRRLG